MAKQPMRKRDRGNEAGPPLSPLPPPQKEAKGGWRYALPLLIAAYLVFAILHALHTPTGETGYQNAPDEAAHVAYAKAVAQGHLPTQADAQADPKGQSYEWHQPPLYYAIVAPFSPHGYFAMRCVSIACGLLGILLIYRTGRLMFPEEPLIAILAAGFAALLPGHIAITSTVNNDVLLEVGFSATILLLFMALHSGFTLWRAGWLGVILGATILTKATGLLLIPVVLFAMVMMWRGGEKPQNLVRGGAWSLALAALVCGWWFVRNGQLYHEWMPLQLFQKEFKDTAQAVEWADRLGGWGNYWLVVAQWSFQSFWAVYGTKESAHNGVPVFLPWRMYLIFGLVTLTVVGGLTRAHFRRRTDFTQAQLVNLWILFTALGLVMLAFIGFLTKYFQTQGRYLYPAMLPISILFAVG